MIDYYVIGYDGGAGTAVGVSGAHADEVVQASAGSRRAVSIRFIVVRVPSCAGDITAARDGGEEVTGAA
ncbi:hypothetical protein [Nonomuraea rubra]|uniref:Uncharacterized protein n=1 Tax=Nonomuraea rubra TaxID=46180 RepID=A0A7X0P600_9ACTN|nr:hypothetical protein [Nonomuraea rubra]MBB6555880.1 hypothetical protein [Nonomuraea rubra]